MKYRKKPVVIEAVQWTGNNPQEISKFIKDDKVLELELHDAAWEAGKGAPVITLYIHTLEGKMEADVGDFIIKGVKGEFYPCKPDIFASTYDKVEE